MASIRDQLLHVARLFIASLNEWSLDGVLAIRSPDCIQYTFPASFGKPPMTNDEFAKLMSNARPLVQNYKMFYAKGSKAESVTVDVESHKVCLHLKSYTDTKIGPFENEYIFTLYVNKDGEHLDRIEEFLDSACSADFVNRLGSLQKE